MPNKAIKQENLQLAVFTAFNILASYKFPLIEALASKGTVRHMRPTQLKLAILFCIIGLLVDVLYVPFNKELYDGHWVMVFGVKSAISFLWLISFILIFRGFGSLRYIYTAFVIWGLSRIIYSGASLNLDIHILISLLLSITACILWFLPTSNKWFKTSRVVAS